MGWKGSGASADTALSLPPSFFNPFAPVDQHLVVLASTEKLREADASLQWAMHQEGSRESTPPDRGNLGIAQQDLKPSWLSKPGFLQYCSLRSYPLGQLRRLCVVLKERSMPFGHHAVQTLVQQTLYQLGPMVSIGDSSSSSSDSSMTSGAEDGPLGLLWRAEWDEDGSSVLPKLATELQQLADELDQTPREHDAVLLLGQLSAYLADWWPACKAVARRFAAMTSRVADELQQQIDGVATGQEEVAAKLQAKQCKARMMALLCYVAGGLDDEDVGHMLKMMVLVKHGDLFLEDAGVAAELAGLRVLCHDVVARRLPEVLGILQDQQQRNSVLTAAVTLVLQRTPRDLHWQQLMAPLFAGAPVGSFEAVGRDGHLYSINVLDGTVLLDGAPPSRLPLEILEHPLYVRTFGDSNFEVAVTKKGVRQTIKPIKGKFYDFYLADGQQQSSELIVVEVDRARAQRLQLLDVGVDGGYGEWGKELPVRLRELYSHWLSR